MLSSKTDHLKILVLGHPVGEEDISRWLGEQGAVARADTVEAAAKVLRGESFDWVICSGADLARLRDMTVSAQATAIVDSINQGVCLVNGKGDIVWCNARMSAFAVPVRERVQRCCEDTYRWAEVETQATTLTTRSRRFSFSFPDHGHFEVTCTPVFDVHGRPIQVAAVVWDVSYSRRLQDKIDAIDRAGRELVGLDVDQFSKLDTQDRLALLEQKILRSTKELLHFDNFEIRVLNRRSNRLDLVLASGMPADAEHVELYAVPEGNGICGYVASRGQSYICPDATCDPRYLPGLTNAQSSLTVPLRIHDRVVGVANFESTRQSAFSEDDRQFAEIFGRYVALALHILELLVSERQATTGQVFRNVMSEITSPLNSILTEAETVIEDYIGHDDVRRRVRNISELAVRIRETNRACTQTKAGFIGVAPAKPRVADPILQGKRILVADDEETIRETVRDVLAGYGCVVSIARDGAEAVELLTADPFDLVLSDIRMPLKNGYEVFAAAKALNPKIPVILATGFGYDPSHSIVRARREGLAAVLFKPFKVDQLLQEIRSALQVG
ncbi:MAG: response regulator [Planctomycetota bacterium]